MNIMKEIDRVTEQWILAQWIQRAIGIYTGTVGELI